MACYNRQNQIFWLICDAFRVKLPGIDHSTIIVQADPGTCGILPTMHCKSVKMEDI